VVDVRGEAAVPASFTLSVSGRNVSWGSVANAAMTLIYLLDPIIAQGTGNPVLWQDLVVGSVTTTQIPASVALQSGRQYIVPVGIANAAGQRAAFGSLRFTAP
jgi:hypothetical protein